MYSLNVPVPSTVGRLATDLAHDLPRARERPRGERTLVVKRLGDGGPQGVDRLAPQVREAITGTIPFEAAVSGIDLFESPETGTGPVVYLAIESPELLALHDRLCAHFEPVDHFEGTEYVPHVTVARGGPLESARRLADRDVERIAFSVTDLEIWDARRSVPTVQFSLPA